MQILAYICIFNSTQSKDDKFFIHNHLAFTVKYHKDISTDAARIVGFEVKPFRLVFVVPSFIINFLNFPLEL